MLWSKKVQDHTASIEKIAVSLAESDQKAGVLPFVSFKEAEEYAKSRSPLYGIGPRQGNQWVQCHSVIGTGYYALEFEEHPKEGVYLNVAYYGEASDLT